MFGKTAAIAEQPAAPSWKEQRLAELKGELDDLGRKLEATNQLMLAFRQQHCAFLNGVLAWTASLTDFPKIEQEWRELERRRDQLLAQSNLALAERASLLAPR